MREWTVEKFSSFLFVFKLRNAPNVCSNLHIVYHRTLQKASLETDSEVVICMHKVYQEMILGSTPVGKWGHWGEKGDTYLRWSHRDPTGAGKQVGDAGARRALRVVPQWSRAAGFLRLLLWQVSRCRLSLTRSCDVRCGSSLQQMAIPKERPSCMKSQTVSIPSSGRCGCLNHAGRMWAVYPNTCKTVPSTTGHF